MKVGNGRLRVLTSMASLVRPYECQPEADMLAGMRGGI